MQLLVGEIYSSTTSTCRLVSLAFDASFRMEVTRMGASSCVGGIPRRAGLGAWLAARGRRDLCDKCAVVLVALLALAFDLAFSLRASLAEHVRRLVVRCRGLLLCVCVCATSGFNEGGLALKATILPYRHLVFRRVGDAAGPTPWALECSEQGHRALGLGFCSPRGRRATCVVRPRLAGTKNIKKRGHML